MQRLARICGASRLRGLKSGSNGAHSARLQTVASTMGLRLALSTCRHDRSCLSACLLSKRLEPPPEIRCPRDSCRHVPHPSRSILGPSVGRATLGSTKSLLAMMLVGFVRGDSGSGLITGACRAGHE